MLRLNWSIHHYDHGVLTLHCQSLLLFLVALIIGHTVFVHLAVDAFLFHHIGLPEEYIIKHNIAYSIIIITYMCTAYKVAVDVDLNMMLLYSCVALPDQLQAMISYDTKYQRSFGRNVS